MPSDISERLAIVVGAGGGPGGATAQTLAGSGYTDNDSGSWVSPD